jgi:hypothetical protein
MSKHGFKVEKHFIMPTAWRATFSQGIGGRTIGINSEMDALPGIGHACGHNLIAISGVAVACAIKTMMEKFNILGTILLLGTPGITPALMCLPLTKLLSQLKKVGMGKRHCLMQVLTSKWILVSCLCCLFISDVLMIEYNF